MKKVWKIIKPEKYKNVTDCIKAIKKKKVYISPWIENIIKNKKNKITITTKTVYLFVQTGILKMAINLVHGCIIL